MKRHGKPAKKDIQKKLVRCPCFRSYYVGVCAGHSFPYTPTPGEKSRYCMTADFHLCLIYEQYLAAKDRERR